MDFLPKIITIVGPTASGKTGFSIWLAKELERVGLHAEIISADSRQVYIGLDIGTGKVTEEEMGSIPHHMLDVCDPKDIYSVADFVAGATNTIKEIINRGNIPIIVGGTGFYIDTLVRGTSLPNVPKNEELRKELESKSKEELFEMLLKLDDNRAQDIDKDNKVRLIRAIEISKTLGNVPEIKTNTKYNSIFIGINPGDEILQKNIQTRLLQRLDDGMVTEAENLHKEGLSYERMRELGLEYSFLADYLENKKSYEEFISLLNIAIWQYARRQKTWFKRNQDINWINPKNEKEVEEIKNKVLEFLK